MGGTSAYLVGLENAKFTLAKKQRFLSAVQLSERERERATRYREYQEQDHGLSIDSELDPIFVDNYGSLLAEKLQALNLYNSKTTKKVRVLPLPCFHWCPTYLSRLTFKQ
jgi:hypothetical protein